MYEEKEEKKERKKKPIIGFVIGLFVMFILIIGSSYAYFSVNTTNTFGTSTIHGEANSAGSVALTTTNNQLRLNLTADDMKYSNFLATYHATTTGEPNASFTNSIIDIANITASTDTYYNCDYTLNITASGTNNMYTAYQGMVNNTANTLEAQSSIYLIIYTKYSSEVSKGYSFYTPNLFPITINDTIGGISAAYSSRIGAEFFVYNSRYLDHSALQGTDITMNITTTSFSCRAVDPVMEYVKGDDFYQENFSSTPLTNYYLRHSLFENIHRLEICGIFNNTEICMSPSDGNYRTAIEATGATCALTGSNNEIRCSYGNTVCYISDSIVRCGDNTSACMIYKSGDESSIRYINPLVECYNDPIS